MTARLRAERRERDDEHTVFALMPDTGGCDNDLGDGRSLHLGGNPLQVDSSVID